MKKILILGAGRVVKPMVDYFFAHTKHHVTVAGLQVEDNLKFIGEHSRGTLLTIDVQDTELVSSLVDGHDIVVSFLPASFHYNVALLCLKYEKNLVTASYVDEKMKSLHEEATSKNLLFLNEVGLDPGIDHIFTMYMKDKIEEKNGKITSFYSFCGGLPAPEANDNPVGYKFSWSPAGVMKASKNSALYLKNGQNVELPSLEVFTQATNIDIQGLAFVAYANRNSIKYIDLYNFRHTKNVMRGTLRYSGWCEFIRGLLTLNLLDESIEVSFDQTPVDFMLKFMNVSDEQSLENYISEKLGIGNALSANTYLKWLGIYRKDKVLKKGKMTPFDFVVELAIPSMLYLNNERDIVVLCNEMDVEYDGKVEKKRISLVEYAQNGDSAMSRTVSLPAAIATDIILEKNLSQVGVQIPIFKDLYLPILSQLKSLGFSIVDNLS